jgi:hypothetical protein
MCSLYKSMIKKCNHFAFMDGECTYRKPNLSFSIIIFIASQTEPPLLFVFLVFIFIFIFHNVSSFNLISY